MESVTRESLAANAFRTLGLSASAGQSAIMAAARQMRLWPDASRIPPTPWDMPAFGQLRRGKPDIEQAVSLLNQPPVRLEHRLLWFATATPPVEGSTADTLLDRHARTVLALQQATNPVGPAPDWPSLMQQVAAVYQAPELADWLRETESAGRFDKASSPEEQTAALAAVPLAVAGGLIRQASTVYETRGPEAVVALATAIRHVSSQLADELGDRMEDLFNARANTMEQGLREKLRTNHSNPRPYRELNMLLSGRAEAFFREKLTPIVTTIVAISEHDEDRRIRVRTRCADLLTLLALGWEWALEPRRATTCLDEALTIAAGTMMELRVRREMDRLTNKLAELKSARRRAWYGLNPTSWTGKNMTQPRKLQWWHVVLICVFASQALLSLNNSMPSKPALTPLPTMPPIRRMQPPTSPPPMHPFTAPQPAKPYVPNEPGPSSPFWIPPPPPSPHPVMPRRSPQTPQHFPPRRPQPCPLSRP